MFPLLIALATGIGFIVAYHTYGRWLARKIFELSADAICPSHRLEDGQDYVPTPKSVVFGHHFTSIAGTGPIVGPAIAVMWGWLPALLWVVFGSIFIGAVHDFGALVVSLRNNGETVGQVAGRVINKRVRLLFLFVLFLALSIVLAIFGLVIAAVFKQYPSTIVPCLLQIPIAVMIGSWLHRKGVNLFIPSLLALIVMYLTVIFGDIGFLHAINSWASDRSIMEWVIFLLGYSYVASVLPVWLLLQPRDFINSLQLVSALGLIVVGLFVAAFIGGAPVGGGAVVESANARPILEMAAPMVRFDVKDAPAIFPFLFITIACGAISGFHCLVSSGTSSKQLKNESDARFVGFGSMLTEGFLATLVILACCAGLGLGVKLGGDTTLLGSAAWEARYASWSSANALGAKVGAFVDGSANFLSALGIKPSIAVALMGVLVASFAGTTLDTACRLQRYVVQELAKTLLPAPGNATAPGSGETDAGSADRLTANPITWLANKHGATIFAVLVGGLMAAMPAPGNPMTWDNAGKGGLILWPMFGATNQLLGGLAFLVVAFYLWRRKKPVWFIVLPLVFMLIIPAWAMSLQISQWMKADEINMPLLIIAIATIVLEAWMIVEAVLLWPKAKGLIEDNAVQVVTS